MPLLLLGLPDEFVEHGDPIKLLALCGLDASGIEQIDPQALRQPLLYPSSTRWPTTDRA